MRKMTLLALVVLVCGGLSLPANGFEDLIDPRSELRLAEVESVRINLNPRGADLGFEIAVSGDEADLEALIKVILNATPGQGHRCANVGAIRFLMMDGTVIGFGFLPGHEEGVFDIRFYIDGVFTGVYRVDLPALMAAFDSLGVPVDDPRLQQ